MRRLFWLGLVIMLLAGCDTQIAKEPLGSHVEQRQVDCEHWGFCYTWNTSDGEYNYHLSDSCDGKQPALVRVDQYKVTYKSGATDIQNETHTEKVLGECK